MRDAVLVGVDVGTSAARACAFATDGTLIASAIVPLTVDYPRPGWAEQPAAAWSDATVAALRRLAAQLGSATAASVAAIGLAGQCPSFVLVDHAGRPLTRGLIYQDNRATAEAARIADVLGTAQVRARTGQSPSPFYVAPKVMWLDRHHPDLRTRRPWLAQPRDLVARRLTGVLATDPTHAGCTGLYDLEAHAWAHDWAGALDLVWICLPPVLSPTAPVGRLTSTAANDTGLPAGLPVVIGAADNFCADLAMGAVTPGLLGDTTGTSTCLDLTIQCNPQAESLSPVLSLYAHLVSGLLFANGGLNATGAAIAWAAAALAGGDVAHLEALAAAAPPDAAAPVLLPYLGGGERVDAAAMGVWHGLTLAHSPARLARSVYEGVTFALRELVDCFRAAGYPISEARLGGGGSRSALWNGLKADVWNVPVRVAAGAEATALGAALLAGIGVGLYRDLDDATARAVRAGPTRVPDPTHVPLYDELYGRWLAVKAKCGA